MTNKNWCLAFLAATTATLSIIACNTVNSRSLQSAAPTIAVAKDDGMMNHGGMNHGAGGMKHNMDIGPADANYDLRFLDSMIPHHQGALVMSQEVIDKSKRFGLVALAKSIITEQTKEIAQMKKWRKEWYPNASATPMMWHAAMNHEMAMTPEHKQMMQMSMSLGKADREFDLRFLNAMIPHHEGAVTMGKDLLQKSKRPEMQKLAKSIISSQQNEIDAMNQSRKRWYGK